MTQIRSQHDPCCYHLWFAWRPLIFTDQFGQRVFIWLEDVWRVWIPGKGWHYEVVL